MTIKETGPPISNSLTTQSCISGHYLELWLVQKRKLQNEIGDGPQIHRCVSHIDIKALFHVGRVSGRFLIPSGYIMTVKKTLNPKFRML